MSGLSYARHHVEPQPRVASFDRRSTGLRGTASTDTFCSGPSDFRPQRGIIPNQIRARIRIAHRLGAWLMLCIRKFDQWAV